MKGMLINFHLSFRNEKWINCIDFVMRTLQHIEVIIIIIVPAFISFNVSRNEPAKGKQIFVYIQTLVLIVGCVGVTKILQMGIAHRATSDRFFAFLSKTAFPLFIKFKKNLQYLAEIYIDHSLDLFSVFCKFAPGQLVS